jgi:putative hydrolase of the HAD superfamily
MVGAEKPLPAIFQHAITMTHASVTDSWMIGDNPVADVHGARNAGLSAILADGGYPDAAGVTILRAAHAVTDARSPH